MSLICTNPCEWVKDGQVCSRMPCPYGRRYIGTMPRVREPEPVIIMPEHVGKRGVKPKPVLMIQDGVTTRFESLEDAEAKTHYPQEYIKRAIGRKTVTRDGILWKRGEN